MAIDPQRPRRGRAGRSARRWKVLTIASLAVAVQSMPTPSAAQASAPGNAGIPRDPWRFTPSIGLDETWSDNINLAPRGSEQSDFVTTISPALRVTRFGPRVTASFNYNPQLLYYARGTNGTQLRNYLDGSLSATVVDNLLFFDALTSISQSNISPYGTLAANSVNASGNRAETRTYSLGPTLRSRFGNDFSYSAAYRFSGTTSDNSAYAANHTNSLVAQFESGTSLRNFGYGADISRIEQSYGRAGDVVQETVGTTLTYVLSPTFRLRGRIGYDRNSYPTSSQADLKGASYSGGFDWTPSQHTALNAQVGHRYFGPTANITFRETTSRFAVTARYSRDQTTSTGAGLALVANPNYVLVDQFLRPTIPDPVLRAIAVASALQQAGLSTSPFQTTDFLSNQLFLQKVAQASVGFFGLRNTVTLDASRSETRALSNINVGFDVFDQSQQYRTTSYTASLSHRLGPRTTANVSASKVHNQAVIGFGDTRQRVFSVGASRQIQKNLSANVSYRNTRQTGSGIVSNAFNTPGGNFNTGSGNFFSNGYTENAVYGSLRLSF